MDRFGVLVSLTLQIYVFTIEKWYGDLKAHKRCLLVAGWKPGDPLPGIPAMPPGWKPGDPIPLPGSAAAQAGPPAQAPAAQPAAPSAQPEAGSLQKPPPPRPLLQRPVFDVDFLMLGEDNEAVEEDFSSEEDSDE